jgi:hypothetical protein
MKAYKLAGRSMDRKKRGDFTTPAAAVSSSSSSSSSRNTRATNSSTFSASSVSSMTTDDLRKFLEQLGFKSTQMSREQLVKVNHL